jgi:monovalent cation:H+ antiporter-2, CPA2 family
MEEQVRFLADIVAALSVALAGGWLAARVGVSPIVGYVVAGLVISPFTPGFVGDLDQIRLLADVGVVLLLFAVGVQFSMDELIRGGRVVSLLALAQVLASTGIGFLAGQALGFGSLASLFFGAALALASTTVMSKLLAERGDEDTPHAKLAITWAVVQDFCAIILVVLLSVAAGDDVSPGQLAIDGIKIAAFIVGVIIFGSRIVPWALDRVAAAGSRELFLLAIAVLALGTAAAAGAVGISLALGAFLAGLAVSESDRSHHVLGEILPARDIFAVLFFVSVGMLIDPGALADGWHIVLVALLIIIAVKFALTSVPLAIVRTPARTAIISGVLLAQSAELSFVIMEAGVDEDVISDRIFTLTMTAIGASVLLSPLLVRIADRVPVTFGSLGIATEPIEELRLANHAVVVGFNSGGHFAADLLTRRGFTVVVVDEDRRLVDRLRSEGFVCFIGNGANPSVIQHLNLKDAWLFVVAEPDPVIAELAVRRARGINPSLMVIARAVSEQESERLAAAGAREVVVAEQEAGLELARRALMRFGLDSTQARAVIQRIRARSERTT